MKDSGKALYCNLESITLLLLHASSLSQCSIFLIQFSTDKVADRLYRFIYSSGYAYENLENNYTNGQSAIEDDVAGGIAELFKVDIMSSVCKKNSIEIIGDSIVKE